MRDRDIIWEETSKPFQYNDGVTFNPSIFFVSINELAAIFWGKPIISFSLGKLEHNFCGFATKNKIYYTLFCSERYPWFINSLRLRNWNQNSTWKTQRKEKNLNSMKRCARCWHFVKVTSDMTDSWVIVWESRRPWFLTERGLPHQDN